MALSPKESGKLIASLSQHVKINEEGVQNLGNILIEKIKSGYLSPQNFGQNNLHPKPDNPKALDWLFVVDTLNFCFWSQESETGWTVDGHTGYFALCAAINRAIRENIDILNPNFCARVTEKDLQRIFRSDNGVQIPLFQERLNCLREIGTVLLENFGGSFENCVKKAENSAVALLNIIVTNFKCFQDEALYKGHRVGIYKRAQILIGDIWACFQNQAFGYFSDIDEITMFADYRVPQTLLWFGVFEYNSELLAKLSQNINLMNGEESEVEIRGCSIHAVELLRDYVNARLGNGATNAILIDHFLWEFRREHAREILEKRLPFHKTFSVFY